MAENNTDSANTIKIAGRFICLITLTLTDKSIMIIKNLGREESELNDVLEGIASVEYVEHVKLAFQALKNDDSGYYDFELQVGSIPK